MEHTCSICFEANEMELVAFGCQCVARFHHRCMRAWYNSARNSELAQLGLDAAWQWQDKVVVCPCCRAFVKVGRPPPAPRGRRTSLASKAGLHSAIHAFDQCRRTVAAIRTLPASSTRCAATCCATPDVMYICLTIVCHTVSVNSHKIHAPSLGSGASVGGGEVGVAVGGPGRGRITTSGSSV